MPDKKLPAKVNSGAGKVQPALMLSYSVSLYVIFLSVACAAVTCGAALNGDWSLFAVYCVVMGLMFWGYTGLIFESFLVFRLLRLIRERRYFEAERLYLRVTKLWKSLPIRKGGRLGLAFSNLGFVRLLQGNFDDAELPLRESVQWLEGDRRLRDHYVMALAMNNLAVVLTYTGQLDEAETLAKRAHAIYQEKAKSTSGAAFPMIVLSSIYLQREQNDEAEKYLNDAKHLLDHNKSPFLIMDTSIEYARAALQLNFALLRCRQGRIPEARELCESLLDKVARDHLRTISLENIAKVAQLLIVHDEPVLAERLLEAGYAIGCAQPHHQHSGLLLDTFTDLLNSTGRSDEVSDLRRWIRPSLQMIETSG